MCFRVAQNALFEIFWITLTVLKGRGLKLAQNNSQKKIRNFHLKRLIQHFCTGRQWLNYQPTERTSTDDQHCRQ